MQHATPPAVAAAAIGGGRQQRLACSLLLASLGMCATRARDGTGRQSNAKLSSRLLSRTLGGYARYKTHAMAAVEARGRIRPFARIVRLGGWGLGGAFWPFPGCSQSFSRVFTPSALGKKCKNSVE